MSRLLTEEDLLIMRREIKQVIDKAKMAEPADGLFYSAPYADEILSIIAERDKATLKAVGEWLECKIAEEAPDDIGVCFLTDGDMDKLRRGEMPKESK